MSKKSADQSRAARAQEAIRQQAAAQRRRNLVVGGIVAAALVVVVVVVFLLSRSSDPTGRTPDAVPDGTTADYGVLVGDADAPTSLVFYEDPQCPVCREFEQQVGDQVAAAVEAGDVSVEYRVVSFLDDASSNQYSSRAAHALFAVGSTAGADAFVAMHDLLYADQPAEGGPGHSDEELIGYAVQAGADETEVRPLIEDGAFDQWIANATDAMSRNGVNGTPGVIVDGDLVTGNPVEAVLDAIG